MNNFYNADKYFLVDTVRGNLKASNINLVPLSNVAINLYNRRTFKVLSKKRLVDEEAGKESFMPIESLGFLHTSNSPYQDDLDMILWRINECYPLNCSTSETELYQRFSKQIDSLLSYSLGWQWDYNMHASLAALLHQYKVEIYNHRLLDCSN